jgi:predicted esterase
MGEDIHQGTPVLEFGADPEGSRLVVILLHGRGANAESMMPLARALHSDGVRFLMPQAAQERWYPNSAFGPIEANEPDLSSALKRVDALVDQARQHGFSYPQIALGGFSQGACLGAEYAARNARRYGGLFIFSGALIGPGGTPRDYPGSFDGMPVFIGGSDVDPWVSHNLLEETARVFEQMGAEVDFRTYSGMGHTVNQDELHAVREMLAAAKENPT